MANIGDLPQEILKLILEHLLRDYKDQCDPSFFAVMRVNQVFRALAYECYTKHDYRLGKEPSIADAIVGRPMGPEELASWDEYWAKKWVNRQPGEGASGRASGYYEAMIARDERWRNRQRAVPDLLYVM